MSSERKRKRTSSGEAALAAPGAVVLKASTSRGREGSPIKHAATSKDEDMAAWAQFCEEYHDIVEQLPLELKRSFLLVHELEQHMQSSQGKLHIALTDYIGQKRDFERNSKGVNGRHAAEETPEPDDDPASLFSARDRRHTPPPPSPRSKLRNLASEIAKDSRIAIRAGEDKVQQANAMYDTVDRHIRRLDADLAKYEDSLVIGLRAGTLPSSEAPSLFSAAAYSNAPNSVATRGGSERPSAAITAAASLEADITRGVRVDPKAPPSSPVSPQRKAAPQATGRGRGATELERPAEESEEEEEDEESEIVGDESETLYCSCKRISFGDMIACDNDACPTEWFHYECVGLKEAPKGRWFCRDCIKKYGVQARDRDRKRR